jgi:threonine dehydrogenase-like Zn-dependent dehydrogenase
MRALVFDGALALRSDYPDPTPGLGEALIRVRMAGICRTDLEITRGYFGFRGVLGHEFVGMVERAPDAACVGRRVVGEINCACGTCAACRRGLGRHCPHRTVLGILERDGAFADAVRLPLGNLHEVPDSLSDAMATFVEPTAAAFEILEQVAVRPGDRVLVLGDGKLGALVAQVLRLTGCHLVVAGRREDKLATFRTLGIEARMLPGLSERDWDVVVEATGSPEGFGAAVERVRPRGTLVLKTTTAARAALDLAPLVVNEVTVVGSRCGPFRPAIRALAEGRVRVEPLISAVFDLSDGVAAVRRAGEPGVLKVLLRT